MASSSSTTRSTTKDAESSDDEGFFMADFFTKDLDLEDDFEYDYGPLHVTLKGIAREYGQTVLGSGDGTGLTIWRGAEELNNYLWANPSLVQGKRCLELGAGLGLVGILLSNLDASNVVITDGDQDAITRIIDNFALNGFSKVNPSSSSDSDSENSNVSNHILPPILLKSNQQENHNYCHVCKFLWEDIDDLRTIINLSRFQCSNSPDTQYLIDVHDEEGHNNNSYDLIVAADVVYAEEAVVPLIFAVTSLLERSQTSKFILSFARRNVPVQKVIDEGRKKGLTCKTVDGFECEQSGENIYEFQWE